MFQVKFLALDSAQQTPISVLKTDCKNTATEQARLLTGVHGFGYVVKS